MSYRLILASQSPRRKELLGYLKIPFEIVPSYVEEVSAHTDPILFSQEIALLKAKDILQKKSYHEEYIIVGADTIVVIDQKILGKPNSIEDARNMLQRLSGREHSVYTSVVLLHGKREKVFTIETQVTFNPIPESLLQSYLDSKDSLDKAGSYGIQGESLSFISAVKGSYSNVVGFPLSHFITELTEFLGLNLESDWRTSFK